MALKEYENGIYEKENNDPIKSYLRNIIQRYFQIENEISQESKEAIIIQAYTRLKELLNAYNINYIICINERTGAVDLHIRDLGGEEKFEKRTAFNKDFCDITSKTKELYDGTIVEYNNYGMEQEDHIVSGDDDRLSDARIPLLHVHTIDEIKGLRELLENYNLLNNGFHYHKNLKLLNILAYTGSRTSIDLLLLEDLIERVEESIININEYDLYFINTAKRYLNHLKNFLYPIYNRLEYIDTNIDSWISDWLSRSKMYTNVKVTSFKKEIRNFLKGFLTIDEYNKLKAVLENAVVIVDEGTFPIGTDTFELDTIDSRLTKTENAVINEINFELKYGYTMLAFSIIASKQITNNEILSNFHNGKINNGECKLFLEYSINGIRHRDQLPHIYSINDSKEDSVLVFGNTDSNNNINVYAKRISTLPVYLHSQIMFNTHVGDYSGKFSDFNYILLEDSTTEYIYKNKQQDENNTHKLYDSTNSSISRYVIVDPKHIYDLVAVNAPYQTDGQSGSFGKYKELLVFTTAEDYVGNFSITMNTGHWYGFAIWESADGATFTKIRDNYSASNATHNSTPLTLSMSNVHFKDKYTYKIVTEECSGGGTAAQYFKYTFSADKNIFVGIAKFQDINVTFSAEKENLNKVNLTWTLQNSSSYNYKVYKKDFNKWIDLTQGTSFSSSDNGVLKKVYNEGHVYSFYTNGSIVEHTTLADKKTIWDFDANGNLMSTVNNSNMDALLTDELYTSYRHRCTLTSSNSDNDAIIIIISAIKEGNQVHTLSLVCDRGGESHMETNYNGCSLIYDYSLSGYQSSKVLGKFSHGSGGSWSYSTKINFDIRKDNEKILIYCSGFYTTTNDINDYREYNPSESDKKIEISLSQVRSKTGKDFSKGMIGYGNFSQANATVVGINFESFGGFNGTEIIDDNIKDNYRPNTPSISGKCLSSNNDEDIYELNIKYSDKYEDVKYKLSIFPSWNAENPNDIDTPILETSPITITTFSGIKDVYYNIGVAGNNSFLRSNEVIEVVSEENISENEKRIIIKKRKNIFNDKIIFCDNTYVDDHEHTTEYLSKFNCELVKITNDTIKNYVNSIILPTPENKYQYYRINKTSNKYDFISSNEEFSNDYDLFTEYVGEFDYGSLRTFLNDATVRYQLFKVPGKGENDS